MWIKCVKCNRKMLYEEVSEKFPVKLQCPACSYRIQVFDEWDKK